MIVPNDFIIDCSEVPPVERIDNFFSDVPLPENIEAKFGHWSEEAGRMEVDLPESESFPETEMLNHPVSALTEWTKSRKEFESDLLSIDLDPDVESAEEARVSWLESRSARPSAFFTSVLVHCSLFVSFAFFPATQVGGTPGYAGNVLSATIVSQEELIPQDERPASIDSPASAPSIAKKTKRLKEPRALEPPKAIDLQEVILHPTSIAMLEKPDLLEKKEESKKREEVTKEKEADPRGDSLQNSLASMPSTASPERRFIPAAGQAGEAFDAMVLSAIREAVFYPKQAAQERQHGEVVVAFAINKDRSISSLVIIDSSGFTILDEAAIKIIQKAAKKFPSFPDGLGTDTLRYVVPILFKEKGK
ncbi:MAG TPA: TonB family protein [Desulfomonilaceae bacterium]|nr:TonB family protein [Desulfomonilaceae bacterium]